MGRATPLLGHEGPVPRVRRRQPDLRRARLPVRRRRDRPAHAAALLHPALHLHSRWWRACSWRCTSGASGATASPARRCEAMAEDRRCACWCLPDSLRAWSSCGLLYLAGEAHAGPLCCAAKRSEGVRWRRAQLEEPSPPAKRIEVPIKKAAARATTRSTPGRTWCARSSSARSSSWSLLIVWSLLVDAPLEEPANPDAHAEPVEGAVVLPRPAGDAGLLRSLARRRGAAELHHHRPDGDPVHRHQSATGTATTRFSDASSRSSPSSSASTSCGCR